MRVLVEVTVADAATAVAEAERVLDALGSMPVPILLHGEEAGTWPVLGYAQRNDFDARIGLEDTVTGPDGTRLATSNEELVRYALRVAGTPRPAGHSLSRAPRRRNKHRR